MLRSMKKDLRGFTVGATDGDIGKVEDFYFDDTSFTVRHLVVDTGGWLGGRKVLISPIALRDIDWDGKRINAALTKAQVEKSPAIDTDRPVSRQREIEYYSYYGYPYYWTGPFLWGGFLYPFPLSDPLTSLEKERHWDWAGKGGDPHLRSSSTVTGYHIAAADGNIGHVEDVGHSLHDRGHSQLVAGEESAGIARVDRARRLERLEGTRGRDAGPDQEEP
jgi:hypothetical protein